MHRHPIPLLIAVLLAPAFLQAATFNVNRTDDPAPIGCTLTHCTLREAVISAGKTPEADTIVLVGATYYLDLIDGNDGSETEGDLDVRSDMTIVGQPGTVVDGQLMGRLFDVRDAALTLDTLTLRNAATSLDTNSSLNAGAINADSATLVLRNVRIEDCSSQGHGGGVYATDGSQVHIEDSHFERVTGGTGGALHTRTSDVTIISSVFADNHALTSNAGAFYFQGADTTAVIERSTFSGNSGSSSGGGIYHVGGSLSIIDSTFDGNQCPTRNGGAISVSSSTPARTLSVTRSTFIANHAQSGGALAASNNQTTSIQAVLFRDNTAATDGGAVFVTGGTINLSNSTLYDNQADSDGGAIHTFSAELNVFNSTISDNTAPLASAIWAGSNSNITNLGNTIVAGDCETGSSTMLSSGGNLEGPGDSCGLDQADDSVNQSQTELGLELLADNGGPTLTLSLSAESNALGHSRPELCDSLWHDQRYAARASQCDAGAYESDGVAEDFLFADGWQ